MISSIYSFKMTAYYFNLPIYILTGNKIYNSKTYFEIIFRFVFCVKFA